jgi:RNA-directed DNA polymerase
MTSFLAKGIASALLAGEWTERSMVGRVASALGEPHASHVRWMSKLVRYARREFPAPPRDARDALAIALLRSKAWPDVLAARVHVRRSVLDVPEMRPTRFRVPPIATPGDLAAFLHLDVRQLDAYADRRNLSRFAPHERMRHYRYRWVPKPSGGERLLEIPKLRLRAVQREILDRIVSLVPPHDCAHGFRAGRSVIDFVTPHVGRSVVIRIDLRSFFQSIRAGRVNAVWRAVGYPEEVARTLTALTTHAAPSDVVARVGAEQRQRLRTPHLPQGAPTSPGLANLIAFGLDVRLSALAKKLGATYGRYADDIAFSGDESLARVADAVVIEMMTIAMDEGFDVNPKKTRVQKRGVRQHLAGVVLNAHPAWPRPERERFEAILTNCVRFGPSAQNRRNVSDFRARLAGRLAWLAQVDSRAAAEMRPIFDSIRWE